jgi:hypothetical protein
VQLVAQPSLSETDAERRDEATEYLIHLLNALWTICENSPEATAMLTHSGALPSLLQLMRVDIYPEELVTAVGLSVCVLCRV